MTVPPLDYRPCIGILLLNKNGDIFVGERIDAPGAWQMPQGGINAGETPLEAGVRELKEETGITNATFLAISDEWRCYDLPIKLSRKIWQGRYKGQTQLWIALRFTGNDSDIILPSQNPEFINWKWTNTQTLIAEIVEFKREVYREVLEEFALFTGS